jgi:hypothetical protein
MYGLRCLWRGCVWSALLALSACAPRVPAAGACDASPAQGLVGQPVTPLAAEAARLQAGARSVRVIDHDQILSKEFNTTRLSLQLDARGRVVRVFCG